jgi:predicted ArsR family transcriptional regulator
MGGLAVACGWQKYLYVPAFLNVTEYVWKPMSAWIGPVLSTVGGVPLFALWNVPGATVHVTFVPAFTVSEAGSNWFAAVPCTALPPAPEVADALAEPDGADALSEALGAAVVGAGFTVEGTEGTLTGVAFDVGLVRAVSPQAGSARASARTAARRNGRWASMRAAAFLAGLGMRPGYRARRDRREPARGFARPPYIRHNDVVKNIGGEGRTRERVGELLLRTGGATAADLGSELGLSPAAVRRHLDAMLADGTVAETEAAHTGRRGRPARLFVITEAGREAFPHAYDTLATSALRFLAATGGEAVVKEFAAARVAELETRYADVAAAPADERPARLAQALSRDGYAATSAPGQVCQHHCPVQHVAEEFPQLCEAETEFFARLLGSPVRRLTTIAHGDSCCTATVTIAERSST